ncbi:hypothetical protein NMY22_g9860 [Coprinellus aureogranulatus]|nr:hypothetical protein NMY22_g9860 [Coprinellus aureogranulatus]
MRWSPATAIAAADKGEGKEMRLGGDSGKQVTAKWSLTVFAGNLCLAQSSETAGSRQVPVRLCPNNARPSPSPVTSRHYNAIRRRRAHLLYYRSTEHHSASQESRPIPSSTPRHRFAMLVPPCNRYTAPAMLPALDPVPPTTALPTDMTRSSLKAFPRAGQRRYSHEISKRRRAGDLLPGVLSYDRHFAPHYDRGTVQVLAKELDAVGIDGIYKDIAIPLGLYPDITFRSLNHPSPPLGLQGTPEDALFFDYAIVQGRRYMASNRAPSKSSSFVEVFVLERGEACAGELLDIMHVQVDEDHKYVLGHFRWLRPLRETRLDTSTTPWGALESIGVKLWRDGPPLTRTSYPTLLPVHLVNRHVAANQISDIGGISGLATVTLIN